MEGYTKILVTTEIMVHSVVNEEEAQAIVGDTYTNTIHSRRLISFSKPEMTSYEIKEDK